MIVAPIPFRESARLDALHRSHILDTPAEPAFDDLARLAAYVCRTPMAAVSFVDDTRQWFKSVVGLPYTESPRSTAFCAHTILGTDLFIVEDADADERFADHPWVVEPPAIRFYAGAPLITPNGHAIGSLAVMDVAPRTLTQEQRAGMQALAAQVMAQFELREHRYLQSLYSLAVPEGYREVKTSLSESEERNALALQGMLDGVWDWNILTGEDYLSPRWKELLGFASDELPDREETFFDRLHPDDVSNVQGVLRAHLERREPYDVELRLRRRDGAYRWFQSRGQALWDAHGRAYRMVGAITDISERKGVEERLRLSEAYFRALIEQSADIVTVLSLDGVIRFESPSFERLLGYAQHELDGQSVRAYIHQDDVSAALDKFERIVREPGALHSEEFRFRHKDGSWRSFEGVGRVVQDSQGQPCVIVNSRDISVRKHTEGLLRFSEERFRLVAEATNDILWDRDLVTGGHWWSPNARAKFGYDPNAESDVQVWIERIHPDDRDRVLRQIERALVSKASGLSKEYRFRLADGSYGYFYDRGHIVRNASGQPIRMIGAMIDVTFHKQAYTSLETAYQRLQGMSRELQAVESNERRRLSRELHDEVGQLLAGLKFDLVATRQALSDTQGGTVARARERTLRALETTDELFASLRRVVRALRPPVLEELGLKEALEALVSDVQSRSGLACAVAVQGWAGSPADSAIEAALYRIAQELSTNVVRHAQAMTMSVVLTVDSQYWTLIVHDDGAGFDPKAESINGIGVRGVRERAEILGGRVDVSSTPGAGSTVTVWIPVAVTGSSGEGPSRL